MWWGAPNPTHIAARLLNRILPPITLPTPLTAPSGRPYVGLGVRPYVGLGVITAVDEAKGHHHPVGADRTITEVGFGVTHDPADTACGFADYLRGLR